VLLISLLLAVLLKQFWEPFNPLHRDGWFTHFQSGLASLLSKIKVHNKVILFAVGLISVIVGTQFIGLFLQTKAPLIYMLFATVILLYSFGRGDFNSPIGHFIVAEANQDWPNATLIAADLGVEIDDLWQGQWQELNTRFLSRASYLGFERFFAVFFWFVLLGPSGALAYRYTQLWLLQGPSQEVARWLWIIEWPAIRVLGFSFALTGNFVGCINAWKKTLGCKTRSSEAVLFHNLLGALAVDDRLVQNQDVTRRELDALQQLLARTLWCWLGVIALLFIA
jgi:AmpE protein